MTEPIVLDTLNTEGRTPTGQECCRVREFLSVNNVPFDDRNIRKSEAARAELGGRTNDLIVPQLFWHETHIVGFDAAALERLVAEYHGRHEHVPPPGNSLHGAQGGKVAP